MTTPSLASVTVLPEPATVVRDRVLNAIGWAWPALPVTATADPDGAVVLAWCDGPTPAAVRATLTTHDAPRVRLHRTRGAYGTELVLQVMASIAPWTRLTRWGRPAHRHLLDLQDSHMYRDLFALPHTPSTVGEVVDALFDRLNLT